MRLAFLGNHPDGLRLASALSDSGVDIMTRMAFLLASAAVLLMFLTGAVPVRPNDPAAVALKPAAPPVVRAAECRKARGPIKLDGVLDEAAWNNAQELTDFAVFWQNRRPRTATRARLLWDDDYLYFAAQMEDSDVTALVRERNGQTWDDDVIELFLKPAEDRPAYYEFQVNAANTPLEMFLPSRGAGGYHRFAQAATSRIGLQSAVVVDGTLNKWDDKDKGWTVEGRIPWKGFAPTGGRPQVGDRWRFALCRYDYSVAFESPELSSTAPLTQSSFHRYEDYGVLTFVGD